MSITIDTARYFRSHMKEPKGRGCWLFETRDGKIVVQHNGSYAEAKKAAIAHGKESGIQTLFTCP